MKKLMIFIVTMIVSISIYAQQEANDTLCVDLNTKTYTIRLDCGDAILKSAFEKEFFKAIGISYASLFSFVASDADEADIQLTLRKKKKKCELKGSLRCGEEDVDFEGALELVATRLAIAIDRIYFSRK